MVMCVLESSRTHVPSLKRVVSLKLCPACCKRINSFAFEQLDICIPGLDMAGTWPGHTFLGSVPLHSDRVPCTGIGCPAQGSCHGSGSLTTPGCGGGACGARAAGGNAPKGREHQNRISLVRSKLLEMLDHSRSLQVLIIGASS